jgi:hypothetical protein
LQSHLRIAQVGHQSSDLPHGTILACVAILADLANGQSHRRAQFFQVLSYFMHGDTTLFGRVLAQVKSRVDLFGKNALKTFRQRFAQF